MGQHILLTLYPQYNLSSIVPKKRLIAIYKMPNTPDTPSWVYEYIMDEVRNGSISTWEEINALKWTLMYIDTTKTKHDFIAKKKRETFALFALTSQT